MISHCFILLLRRNILSIALCGFTYQALALTLYVSPFGDNKNAGLDASSPIKTMAHAKKLCLQSNDNNFTIFMQGGVVHSDFHMAESEEFYGSGSTDEFGFVWDINKPLTLSTYGSKEKAILYGARYTNGKKEATTPILVYKPSKQKVLIENLYIKMWQKGAIMVMESANVHIRNIKIDSIGTYFIPDKAIPRDSKRYPYVAGVIYPKNSNNILIENIEMTNCHNQFETTDALHGFYCTRLSESEIRNVYMRDVSGSPLKFRRAAANNVIVKNMKCYYTGTTNTHGSDELDQPGFVRYSGDQKSGCPYKVTIKDCVFWYPYCWSDKEDCSKASTQPCSVSNPGVCGGANVCFEDPERIRWENVDFRFDWQPVSGNLPESNIFD